MKKTVGVLLLLVFTVSLATAKEIVWIRVNQLGYTPSQKKVAVLVAKHAIDMDAFVIRQKTDGKEVFRGELSKGYGEYGPFSHSFRLDFTDFTQPGEYYVETAGVQSPAFRIDGSIYSGSADFILRYIRQQRSYFNPYLQDSCHTQDGFVLYGTSVGLADSTFIDVGGGWHDASDYLQYSTTSANATYHLLAAYRDYPEVFKDNKLANGLDGKNGVPDVLDEAKWGLDWLMKMHPKADLMFNQIGDDRDHFMLRLPSEDSLYGRGHERPVYFIDGLPQQRGEFLNATEGTSSTAAKFSSAFNLGAEMWENRDDLYAASLREKAKTALDYAHKKLGVTQTVSVKSPYIYAEEDWKDDMQLAFANMYAYQQEKSYFDSALKYAAEEPIKGWMTRDTANHYQYYPFINLGHYELAKLAPSNDKNVLLKYYEDGISEVWNRAKENAFYRGIPFIWCSNNLTVSFIIQCLWYAELSGDKSYEELAQANIDWLFGVNPWGVSMIYGFPQGGQTPQDPHSAFTRLGGYPIDGGLVDGPVYTDIFESLIGLQLYNEDKYAEFQSDLAVYHDDFGDYSTNEPTMDGTASLVYLMAALESKGHNYVHDNGQWKKDGYGAIIRGDSSEKYVSLVFTAHDFDDGYMPVRNELKTHKIESAFFLTGRYIQKNQEKVEALAKEGHYIGPHSFSHLLYADWETGSTLVTKQEFRDDLSQNIALIRSLGIDYPHCLFIPPYEWYNQEVIEWASEMEVISVNYTPGLRTPADYTYPEMGKRYLSSSAILENMFANEEKDNLNGYIILVHLGTDPKRKDKLYAHLSEIIVRMKNRGYEFKRIDDLLFP